MHLVLQATGIRHDLIEQAAALASANRITPLNACAMRLEDIDETTVEQLQDWARSRHVDIAALQLIRPLAQMKVLAMDMDSTLINIECIDEIAGMVGKKAEVSAITEAAMRGEIKDFSESLCRRVALLKGVPETDLQRVYDERLQLNTGAEKLIRAMKGAGVHVMVVSGGFTFFTEKLRTRLGLDSVHANVLEVNNGKLTGQVIGDIVDGQRKAAHLQTLAASLGATTEQCIAIGDGSNDQEMLSNAAYSVAYRAKPVLQKAAAFRINYSGLDAVLNWFED
ncbi:phosphoserine phosphatase SerB [Advenella sp. S44]|uniref:phosphoserine phosphatase SerB n=1 Tax=Advenella sp. S44 TaxID=1982755 RepID=UPI000C2A9FF9|nr:phosphoserine phosphatase SerB [Advenella sp. S44]PJX26203.1 phosphoserine phosphatase SerB [Advenella sp. S44]